MFYQSVTQYCHKTVWGSTNLSHSAITDSLCSTNLSHNTVTRQYMKVRVFYQSVMQYCHKTVWGSTNRARGGGGAGGLQPLHFFGNYKELLRKRCFQPPHFQSSSAGPDQPVTQCYHKQSGFYQPVTQHCYKTVHVSWSVLSIYLLPTITRESGGLPACHIILSQDITEKNLAVTPYCHKKLRSNTSLSHHTVTRH